MWSSTFNSDEYIAYDCDFIIRGKNKRFPEIHINTKYDLQMESTVCAFFIHYIKATGCLS